MPFVTRRGPASVSHGTEELGRVSVVVVVREGLNVTCDVSSVPREHRTPMHMAVTEAGTFAQGHPHVHSPLSPLHRRGPAPGEG